MLKMLKRIFSSVKLIVFRILEKASRIAAGNPGLVDDTATLLSDLTDLSAGHYENKWPLIARITVYVLKIIQEIFRKNE